MYHADPTSATYQNTVPKPKTAVSIRRCATVNANRPRSSQTIPTVMAAKMQLATFCANSGPNTATNGVSMSAGTGG
jgi:hypothetical protein